MPQYGHFPRTFIEVPWTLTVVTTGVSQTFNIDLAGTTLNIIVNWGDTSSNTYTTAGTKTHTFASAGTYYVTITGTLTGTSAYVVFYTATGNTSQRITATTPIAGVTGITNVVNMFRGAMITSLPAGMFRNCPSLIAILRNLLRLHQVDRNSGNVV